MHPLAKKLLIARQLRLDDGELIVLGDRALMIPFDIISGLEDVVPQEKVYELGAKAGKEIVEHLKKMGLKAEKLGHFAHDLLSMSGWGKFSLLKMDKGGVVVHVENSMTGKREVCNDKCEKRCYFLAGVLGHLWKDAMNVEKFVAKETKCICTGSTICEFVVGSK